MTPEKYKDKLKYFENCDTSEERKIRFIENLYKLAHHNFTQFKKLHWQELV